MSKVLAGVEGVEGFHVPAINELLGEAIPRLASVLNSRIRFALQQWIPMSCGKGPVVANNADHLGSDVGLQEFCGHLAMTGISECLADVMAKGCRDHFVVGTRSFSTSCRLQSVL